MSHNTDVFLLPDMFAFHLKRCSCRRKFDFWFFRMRTKKDECFSNNLYNINLTFPGQFVSTFFFRQRTTVQHLAFDQLMIEQLRFNFTSGFRRKPLFAQIYHRFKRMRQGSQISFLFSGQFQLPCSISLGTLKKPFSRYGLNCSGETGDFCILSSRIPHK